MYKFAIIRDKHKLAGQIKRYAILEVNRRNWYQNLFISLLVHAATTRNPALLNSFIDILSINDQAAARSYVMRFSYEMEDGVLLKNEEGQPISTPYHFLDFETKKQFVVVKGTSEQSAAFIPFAETVLLVPSQTYPNFLIRNNVKDEQTFSNVALLKILSGAMAKTTSKSGDVDNGNVIVLRDAIAAISKRNDIIEEESKAPRNKTETNAFDAASAEIADATIVANDEEPTEETRTNV